MRAAMAHAPRRSALDAGGSSRRGRLLRRQSGQRGAAVLMALFVATLATLIVSGLFWQQFLLLRTIENQQLVVQSRVLLAGALDWARSMLREDSLRSSYDGLDEFWAKGLAQTRLDQLGETSTLAAQATIAGSIEDAQSRLNLRNLVGDDGVIVERELAALKRLCELLDVPTVTADLLALRMQEAFALPAEGDAAGLAAAETARPLPPILASDIAAVPGVEPQAADRLAAYLAVLDTNKARVNVNTAPAEVIAARTGVTLSRARGLVAERERISHFTNTGEIRTRLGEESGIDLSDEVIATATSYFFVRGQIRLARADVRIEALVRRPPQTQAGGAPVEILWQREL
jgi:general secretion pathway protein K